MGTAPSYPSGEQPDECAGARLERRPRAAAGQLGRPARDGGRCRGSATVGMTAAGLL